MTDIFMPGSGDFREFDGWVQEVLTLPGGYRHVAVYESPEGEMWDLGQNAEGNFLMFRRQTTAGLDGSHVRKGEKVPPEHMLGFGLMPWQSNDDPQFGEFSSLNKTQLLHHPLSARI